jgi:hypothetical protein
MQAILIVASLWATADPVPRAPQPIGPWLAGQTQLAIKHIQKARTKLDRWAEKTFDVAFDIQVLSLADDAAREIRFVANVDERTKGSIVIPREQTEAVRRLTPHIVAAGDAKIAAEHTVVTRAGTPGTAETYVKVGVTYVDPKGVTRVGLMRQLEGDAFRVHPTDVTLLSTKFSVTMYSHRTPNGAVATSEFTTRANLNLGESLLIFRPAASPTAVQRRSVLAMGFVGLPDPQPSQPALIVITPRRVVRAGESKPRTF